MNKDLSIQMELYYALLDAFDGDAKAALEFLRSQTKKQ